MVPPADQSDPNGQDLPARSAPTVLLVDDEILIRLTTAEQLRADGMIVMEAVNAEEAIAVLDSGVRVDLVLTDVRMPGTMDGLGLARLVRSRWPQLKVIVYSGEDHTSAIDARTADAFVRKPHDDLALIRLIRQLLEIMRDH